MEHLPQRTGQVGSIFPTVPYLCQDKYDEGPFLDYPRRLGLPNFEVDRTLRLSHRLSRASREILAAVPPVEAEPFFQNWLFFGLLHEILGALYRHDDFVTTLLDGEIEKPIITTERLLSRLEAWEAQLTQDTGSLTAVYEHIVKCLNLTYACLDAQYPTLNNNFKFHLASVAEVLGYAASKACNVAWTDDPGRSLLPIGWGRTISVEFRKSVLLERGNCCPSRMQMPMHDFESPQALSFFASCFHDGVQSPHSSCDEDTCRAGASMTPGQITRHVTESCKCKYLSVDEDLLADCIRRGSLPLLRIKDETDFEKMSIEVVPSAESTFYVALSHVWTDGLGNPEATALPRCQLSRLKVLIDNLDFEYLDTSYHPEDATQILLWCDTLCCPVLSEEAHNLALRQMYRTYDQASVVLVLDKSLVSHRVGGMRVDEGCLRIAASRWMTRLWTLQEGALPARKNRLWFQFGKSALPFVTLCDVLDKIHKTDIRRRGVVDSVQGRFHKFGHLFDIQSGKEGAHMRDIISGLLYRSVTIPSDEPLIIATLLAVDLSEILASKPAERMNMLWRIIGTSSSGIDKQILFHMGPKIRECGLRWAPQSLLSVDSLFVIPKRGEHENRGFLAIRGNAKGLIVELAGFRITIAKPAKRLPEHLAGFDSLPVNNEDRQRLLLKDREGRWYLLKPRLFAISDRPPAPKELCDVISQLCNSWILYRGSSSPVPENTKAHLGLLVEEESGQQSQNKEIMSVSIKSQVDFGHFPTEMSRICEAAYCLTQELASSAAFRQLEGLRAPRTELEKQVYLEALQGVSLESQRLSRSAFAMEALAASGNSADERGSTRIDEYMERIYRGRYLQIEEYASGDRKWCVD